MSLNHDMTKVLKCYVKRKSLGEIQFDEKQKESGVKICEHLIHEHSNKNNGKDKLRLITQISHVSDNCETPIPSTDRSAFTNKEESPDRIQQSPDLSNYYIKSLALSHIKSKSLDNDHDKNLHPNHKTIITTIVGDKSSNYERVHNTTFTHSSKGNKIANGNSFTRPVASSNSSSNSRHESYYSLPSQIHRSQHVPSNEKLYQVNKKKFSTKKILKKLFSSSKSQKKNEVNLKQIDKLAELKVQSCMTPPFDHNDKFTRQDSKKTTLVLNFNQHLPFKSHKIGEKLEPLNKDKKKKEVPNFINSIITPQNLFFKSNRYSDTNNNIKNKSTHTIDADGGGNNTKVLVADLLATDGNEEFQYHINPDEPDYTDGNEDYNNVFFTSDPSVRQRSVSGNVSFSHFDVMMKEKERRTSCPTPQGPSCNCYDRKINLIVDILNLVIMKKKDLLNQKKMEIKSYDEELGHFIDCSIGRQVKGNGVTTLEDNWRQSQASLYSINSCLLCSKDLYPNISPLIKLLENDDEMECPIETIDYFVQASCYNHFEKGLRLTVGINCTLKNVALLYYLTRRIVKHIGDPTDEDNKKIKKILKYSERFYQDNYYPIIKNIHKSMESFLVSYNDNDNDDVD